MHISLKEYKELQLMVYNIGKYIKEKRKELGISQEELAEGICEPHSISRIESGNRMPKRETLFHILQRLGVSGSEMAFMTTRDDVTYCQLKFDMIQEYIVGNYDKTEKILRDNKDYISKLAPIDRQTFDAVDVILKSHNQSLTDKETLVRLEEILRITRPKYSKDNLPNFLSYIEILLLNNIAIKYYHLGDKDKAIEILYHIKGFYDNRICDVEEILRTKPMILYNLSKYLGLAQKYDECISACRENITLAQETGRCAHLKLSYYNLSWSLYFRNNPGDYEASIYYLKLAYYCALTMNNKESIEKYAKVMLDRYGINVESV